jgi:hypothetical protein
MFGSGGVAGARASAGRRRRTKGRAIVVVLLALAMTGLVAQPALAKPKPGSDAPTKICDRKLASAPTKCDAPGATGVADTIGGALIGFAVNHLAGFALSKTALGKILDPTSTALADLKASVTAIQGQINGLRIQITSLQQDIKGLALQGYLIQLEDYVGKISSLYTGNYQPTLRAEQAYAEADRVAVENGSTCLFTADCLKKWVEFQKQRGLFLDAAGTPDFQALNTNMHVLLMPGTNGNSPLRAYGSYLLKTGDGIFTAADSARLLAFYDYFREWEALATLMKAQYKAAVQFSDNEPEFDLFTTAEVTGYRDAEQALAPHPIPGNAIVVTPIKPDQRTGTMGMPMWLWDGSIGTSLVWNPGQPAGTNPLPATCVAARTVSTPTCAVDAAVNTFDTTSAGLGFRDWKVPSKADWDTLLTDQPGADAKAFLLATFPNLVADPTAFKNAVGTYGYLWTTEPAGIPSTTFSPALDCNRHTAPILVAKMTGYAHTAIPVAAALKSYPANYPLTNVPDMGQFIQTSPDTTLTNAGYIQYCKDKLARTVTSRFATKPPEYGIQDRRGAQLFVMRKTTEEYLPLTP